MSLTPEEIADKEFLVGLRGYDKDEVRRFLRTVSEAFAAQPAEATEAADGPTEAAAETGAPAPTDWSNLGEEIAAVLRTAHEQAATLRDDAQAEATGLRKTASDDAAAARAAADAYAEQTRADAEEERTAAAAKLTAAQDEALALVADAQARVDRMLEQSKARAKEEAEASVAELTGQIADLAAQRDRARSSLGELRDHLDVAISAAESSPSVPTPVGVGDA